MSQELVTTKQPESPQSIAKLRLSPLLFESLVKTEKIKDNKEKLDGQQAVDKGLSLLGYLEEYYLIPKLGQAENFDQKIHQKALLPRILELLAYPDVRKLFAEELDQELVAFTTAKRPMNSVRKIEAKLTNLRQDIYQTYLEAKKTYGKLPQSQAEQIGERQGEIEQIAGEKEGIFAIANDSTLGFLEAQKLLTYKQQLKEKGFALTPSRQDLIDRITREALSGKKIFLVGSTGTGKTQLAFYVLNSLGGFEIIPWHEGTTPRDIFGYRELYEDEQGKVQSGIKPGPYPRALEQRKSLVHEEFTGGSTRTQLAIKYLMGARPGEKVQIPGFNGEAHEITENFVELFTGNPKDERTKQREEMDPAILRELTGVEVSYMSAQEMQDIILAQLIEESGVLRLSWSEIELIKKLCQAAEVMQRVHNRDFDYLPDEIKELLGIDNQGNTETTLNANFLDPGTLFKLFNEWELERARGNDFGAYLTEKLLEFVGDPKTMSVPEERQTLRKILTAFGLYGDDLAGREGEKSYILPSELAKLNPRPVKNPMPVEESTVELEEVDYRNYDQLRKREVEAWEKVLVTKEKIAPLPNYLTKEVIKNLEELGLEMRFVPKLEIGTLEELGSMGVEAFVERICQRYPGLHRYEAMSDQDKNNHDIARLMDKDYWEAVSQGKIPFPEYSPGWLAVETLAKPNYGTAYQETELSAILMESSHPGSTAPLERFNFDWNRATQHVDRAKDKIINRLELSSVKNKIEIRLPEAHEYNLLANREGWGKTNTWEWVNTPYDSGAQRLNLGYSAHGGAARVGWDVPEITYGFLGFRVAVVFEP